MGARWRGGGAEQRLGGGKGSRNGQSGERVRRGLHFYNQIVILEHAEEKKSASQESIHNT